MARSRFTLLVAQLTLVCAGVLTLYPVVWMLLASFRTNNEIFAGTVFTRGSAGWGNYVHAFAQRPFFLYLCNSLLAALVSVAITIVLGALAGYGFAKYRFRVRGALWLFVLSSLMIPLEAIVIPLFLEVHSFGWTNTYAGLVLPTAFNVVGVFVFRQAMLAIPDDYIDAARMDGASEPRILLSVIMPMVRPSMVVVAVLTFNLSWNSYLWPLIVASGDDLRTLPLGMAAFQNSFNTQYGEVMAVSVFGAIPTTLFFAFFQRYMLEGTLATGVK